MRHYPETLKLALIQKFLSQPHRSMRSIAKEAGVSKTALHEWISNYRNSNNMMPRLSSQAWPLLKRLKAVIESEQLDEKELGKYCRSHGIYRGHLEQWRIAFMKEHKILEWQKVQAENKDLRAENIKLERALKKSEQVLAETRALLELKKKVNLLLGENGGN